MLSGYCTADGHPGRFVHRSSTISGSREEASNFLESGGGAPGGTGGGENLQKLGNGDREPHRPPARPLLGLVWPLSLLLRLLSTGVLHGNSRTMMKKPYGSAWTGCTVPDIWRISCQEEHLGDSKAEASAKGLPLPYFFFFFHTPHRSRNLGSDFRMHRFPVARLGSEFRNRSSHYWTGSPKWKDSHSTGQRYASDITG